MKISASMPPGVGESSSGAGRACDGAGASGSERGGGGGMSMSVSDKLASLFLGERSTAGVGRRCYAEASGFPRIGLGAEAAPRAMFAKRIRRTPQ